MVKRKVLAILTLMVIVLFSNFVHAQEGLTVEVIELGKDVEADGEAEYQLNITSFQGERDIYRISYNEFSIFPFSDFARSIIIEPSQLKLDPLENGYVNITIKVMETVKQEQAYETILKIYSLTNENVKKEAALKTFVVSPQDIIMIFPDIPDEVLPGEEHIITIRFKNRANIPLENYEILISSDLPQLQKNFIVDFEAKEEIVEEIVFKVDKTAEYGNYIINIKVYDGTKTRGSFSSAFTIEKNENIEEIKEKDIGFFTSTKTITKKNTGNTVEDQKLEIKLNFFAKLFTEPSPQPKIVDNKYIWDFRLGPGDEFSVNLKSNYRSIFYGIIVIIIATYFMNFYIDRTVIIRKRIYKMKKSADGHSELKVLIHLKNGMANEISGVRVLDVLPSTFKPTEEYGTLQPTKIQHGRKSKRFVWEIGRLAPKEERIISYKIQSNVRVLDGTKLPPTFVHFTTNKGKVMSEGSMSVIIDQPAKPVKQDKSL